MAMYQPQLGYALTLRPQIRILLYKGNLSGISNRATAH
jgi:hypothetical protein